MPALSSLGICSAEYPASPPGLRYTSLRLDTVQIHCLDHLCLLFTSKRCVKGPRALRLIGLTFQNIFICRDPAVLTGAWRAGRVENGKACLPALEFGCFGGSGS